MENEISLVKTTFKVYNTMFITKDYINQEFMNEELKTYIKKESITGFTPRCKNGFINDLSCLDNFQEFKYLNLNQHNYKNLKSIEKLKNLECFYFTGNYEGELDFSNFLKLKDLTILYQKKFKNIFECKNLKKLTIYHYQNKEKDITEFLKLSKLQFLEICTSPIKNIDYLNSLEELESLELRYLRNLESIKGLKNHSKISRLWIQNCKKVKDLELIGSLTNLTTLTIDSCGNLPSLDFLKKLNHLKSIRLVSTTVLDGKLSWLLEKKTMKHISTPVSKSYDITYEELAIFNNR